jgi:transposase, IS5 family
MIQRLKKNKNGAKEARQASKKIKTIAGVLVRELHRKLPPDRLNHYSQDLQLFTKVLAQQKADSNKTYSLHEPQVKCYTKGKEHKKFEFGSKVSILVTQTTGVIVGALNFNSKEHNSKTLEAAVEQYERLTDRKAKDIYVDRGYRGASQIKETKIHTPKPDKILQDKREKGTADVPLMSQ